MERVAIVGLGLVGGSFALALRKAGFAGEIIAVSSPEAVEAGIRRGAVSRGCALIEAAEIADLIYLAQPVDRILVTIEELGPMVPKSCLVTDAGSTKVAIVKKAQQDLPSGQFLGGHPLAGKAQRGVEAAAGDLFTGRPYVLTVGKTSTANMECFRSWLRAIGANVVDMSPEDHDRTVALTSHVPQVVSTALALALARQQNDQLAEVFGPGLLDMTRLALSDVALWAGILASNEANVRAALDSFLVSLSEVRDAIGQPELSELFHSAANFSSGLRKIPFST